MGSAAGQLRHGRLSRQLAAEEADVSERLGKSFDGIEKGSYAVR